jgi:hypothetical protein
LRTTAASPASTAAIAIAPELLLSWCRGSFGVGLRLLKLGLVWLGLKFRLALFRLAGRWLRKYRLQRRGSLPRLLLFRLLFAPPVAVA